MRKNRQPDLEAIDKDFQDFLKRKPKEDNTKDAKATLRMKKLENLFEAAGDEHYSPDKYTAESIFLYHFVNWEMEEDFPSIARFYLERRYRAFPTFERTIYLPDDITSVGPAQTWIRKILNILFSDYKSGGELARELLFSLFKTYYPKEYKQLKRFRQISASELNALANDEKNEFSVSRLALFLCMCDVMRIRMERSCLLLYEMLSEVYDDYAFEEEEPPLFVSHQGEEYEAARQAVEGFLAPVRPPYYRAKELRRYNDTDQFIEKVFLHCNMRSDFDLLCNGDFRIPMERSFVTTWLLLKKTFPKKEISFEDLQFYDRLRVTVEALCDGFWHLDEMLDNSLVKEESYGEEDTMLFRPEKIRDDFDSSPASPPVPVLTPIVEKEPADHEAELLAQIESLQVQLRRAQQEKKQMGMQLAEMRDKLQQYSTLEKELDEARDELISLRDHVYRSTQGAEPTPHVSAQNMEKALSKKRIVIIGGHENWVYKLRNMFPAWSFISPKVSGSIDPKLTLGADHVYFFTDTISHSTYHRFLANLRESRIPFGYIHSINIERNIRQIYEDCC